MIFILAVIGFWNVFCEKILCPHLKNPTKLDPFEKQENN